MADTTEAPIPAGWKLWTDPKVPPELTKFAMAVRDKINSYQYNTIAETTTAPDGRTVGAWKSAHSWTYKKQPDGSTKLLTGLHIPGISLVIKTDAPSAAGDATISGEGGPPPMPHPHAFRLLAYPVESAGWRRLGVPVAAAVVVGAGALLFEFALPIAAGAALVSAGAAYLFGKR
jgi:hypothetical protein